MELESALWPLSRPSNWSGCRPLAPVAWQSVVFPSFRLARGDWRLGSGYTHVGPRAAAGLQQLAASSCQSTSRGPRRVDQTWASVVHGELRAVFQDAYSCLWDRASALCKACLFGGWWRQRPAAQDPSRHLPNTAISPTGPCATFVN